MRKLVLMVALAAGVCVVAAELTEAKAFGGRRKATCETPCPAPSCPAPAPVYVVVAPAPVCEAAPVCSPCPPPSCKSGGLFRRCR